MSEDKKELKNEELCEGKKKLSMEELDKVNGGFWGLVKIHEAPIDDSV